METLTQEVTVPMWVWLLITVYLAMGSPKFDYQALRKFGIGCYLLTRRLGRWVKGRHDIL